MIFCSFLASLALRVKFFDVFPDSVLCLWGKCGKWKVVCNIAQNLKRYHIKTNNFSDSGTLTRLLSVNSFHIVIVKFLFIIWYLCMFCTICWQNFHAVIKMRTFSLFAWKTYKYFILESREARKLQQQQVGTFYTARSAGQRSCVNRQHLGRRGRLELGAVVGQGSCAMIGQCPIVLGSPRLRCTLYRNCTVGSSVHCTLVYSADCSEGSADHSFVKCLFY